MVVLNAPDPSSTVGAGAAGGCVCVVDVDEGYGCGHTSAGGRGTCTPGTAGSQRESIAGVGCGSTAPASPTSPASTITAAFTLKIHTKS